MSVSYSLDFPSLRSSLELAKLTPTQIARDVLKATDGNDAHHTWIYRLPAQDILAQAARLEADPALRELPLYGVPYAVKDNIDVAGYPTTAGCPAYSYTPRVSSTAVRRLADAGAILIGKTNLDQFATGLSGTRSPYGACRNAFDSRYISGGSSSGSAVAVAQNLVSFALGTDTAGSGRVPAGYNNIVGLKPTRGTVSTAGVVAACRTLDCVSIFALTAADAYTVYRAIRGYDAADPYSRAPSSCSHLPEQGLRCGIPARSALQFFNDIEAEQLFDRGIALIGEIGADIVEIDYAPFRETADLLYGGPWVAERLAALEEFITEHADQVQPVTRDIILSGRKFSAAQTFAAQYRLEALKQRACAELAKIDVLALPTAPTIYTLAQMADDPVKLNANLGIYTNFVNLLDLAAIAVPAGMRGDGLPAGITLIAAPYSEPLLCELGDALHRASGVTLGATQFALPPSAPAAFRDASSEVTVAVVGAHLSGMPLNHQLTELGARLAAETTTAPCYRLVLLADANPVKPGLVRSINGDGHAIAVELWRMPIDRFGKFVTLIPPPLGIGTVALADGGAALGFLCESYAAADARDISEYGGWRHYMAAVRGQTD